MEILAIIPVRGGSKGIPGKNIKMLAGKPLVEYSIDAAKKSKFVTRVVVSTEDSKIKKIVESLGVEVVDRPVELAQDETKTIPVLLQVVNELEKDGYIPDVVVLLQATCPLRDEKELDEAFELFFNSKDCDSVFAAKNIGTTHSLWRKNPNNGKYDCLYDYRNRPRRQETQFHYPMYRETGATYIIKTTVMKQVKDFIGYNPELYLDGSLLDIDTVDDFKKAEEIILKRRESDEKNI